MKPTNHIQKAIIHVLEQAEDQAYSKGMTFVSYGRGVPINETDIQITLSKRLNMTIAASLLRKHLDELISKGIIQEKKVYPHGWSGFKYKTQSLSLVR